METTEVERKAIEDAAFGGGARQVSFCENPMLAALGARLPLGDSSMMLVDIAEGQPRLL